MSCYPAVSCTGTDTLVFWAKKHLETSSEPKGTDVGVPCRLQDQAPPHLAITHYTELLDDKGLVLAKADAISPHLISTAEVTHTYDAVS